MILVGSATAAPATAVLNNGIGGHVKFNGLTTMSSVYAMDEVALADKWRIEGGVRIDFFILSGDKGTYSGSSMASGGTGFILSGMTPW